MDRYFNSLLKALRSFVSVIKISYGDTSIAVEPEPGVADSGNLELDLAELFVEVGKAAREAGKAWSLFIDEVQYLSSKDLAALIVAMHRVNQSNLPIIFFGAGLPQVAALSGNAKSYAERLFAYPAVGALKEDDAKAAIRQPVIAEGASISEKALDDIFAQTRGYPYFLQEWGHQSWRVATGDRIEHRDISEASKLAIDQLDKEFFKVRFDRLTPREREYVIVMAQLGEGPYRSGDVADKLGESPQKVGPHRQSIIRKGMIYSPSHGDIDFTVPLFNEYLMRCYPDGA